MSNPRFYLVTTPTGVTAYYKAGFIPQREITPYDLEVPDEATLKARLEELGIPYSGYTHLEGDTSSVLEAFFGTDSSMMVFADQFRRALQLFIQSLEDESTIQEVAAVYDPWVASKTTLYPVGTILRYGTNSQGDIQLYKVLEKVPSEAAMYTPDQLPRYYKAIGFHEDYPIWSQPTGAHDAYNVGDIVWYQDQLWICTKGDASGKNSWAPGVFGWEAYTPTTQKGE